jgi:DNA repair photolyase
MAGKPVLWRLPAKTVLSYKPYEAFQEKLLCDGLTLNLGDACVYSCAFCYVGSQIRKLTYLEVKAYNNTHGENRGHEEVVIRRGAPEGNPAETRTAVQILEDQLAGKVPGFLPRRKLEELKEQELVVYSSTLVDVGANLTLLRETAEACTRILDQTHWQIRLLSKGNLLPKLVKDGLIPDRTREGSKFSHHERLIFGFSTGTLNDQLAAAFECGTARVSRRIEALHWLQDHGYRTFGMICPSLPQDDYDHFSSSMAKALRIEKLEHVWAEVLNARGKSFTRTYEALQRGGFNHEAERLREVSDGPAYKQHWEQYARATFEAHARHLGPKLRYLQYVDRSNLADWAKQRKAGAVLLGKAAMDAGLSTVELSAPAHWYANPPALERPAAGEAQGAPIATTVADTPQPLTAGQKAAETRRKNREAAVLAAPGKPQAAIPEGREVLRERMALLLELREVTAVMVFEGERVVESSGAFEADPAAMVRLKHAEYEFIIQCRQKPNERTLRAIHNQLDGGA